MCGRFVSLEEPRIKCSTFNARVESVATAPSFREPLKRRRCIVPAIGWYEWQEQPGGKLPWYLHAANDELLNFAGLWDRWKKDGEVIESCSIVVGPANAAFNPIHDRMPFALDRERAMRWLDRKLQKSADAMALLTPNPDDAIAWHRVDRRVSNARNQGEELIKQMEETPDPPKYIPVIYPLLFKKPRRDDIKKTIPIPYWVYLKAESKRSDVLLPHRRRSAGKRRIVRITLRAGRIHRVTINRIELRIARKPCRQIRVGKKKFTEHRRVSVTRTNQHIRGIAVQAATGKIRAPKQRP